MKIKATTKGILVTVYLIIFWNISKWGPEIV